MASNYHIKWDESNKKWTVSVDGAVFSDLVENSLHEKITFNGISVPSGIASKGVIYYDSTANRLRLSENNGPFYNIGKADQVKSWLFSSGQFFGTSDTNLTSYDYTFAADELKVGDTLHIAGTNFIGGTTAGTKSLTLTLGAGAARTIYSTTSAVVNTNIHFRIDLFVRSTTTVAIEGFAFLGLQSAAITETWLVGAIWNVSDITSNSQLLRWVGKHTGSATESKMTDLAVRMFRGSGNYTTV